MKKFFVTVCSMLLCATFAFGGCAQPHTDHVDENSDGKCDICGEEVPTPKPPHTAHIDKDGDGKCDECGAEVPAPEPPHTEHFDENKDGKCDECGADMPTPEPPHTEHVDEDKDGKCDECGQDMPTPEPPHTEHFDEDKDGKCDECGEEVEIPPVEEPFSVAYRAGYAPSKFTSAGAPEITELGDGVHLVKNTVTKTNGQTSVVWTIEVDLRKANIVAGTKNNATKDFAYGKAAPYAMAQAWEKATGGHVYSSLNADFFGEYCVNAFVKDGYIIKDGHNDNYNYDYLQGASDVPASAPMLFGIKGTTAQIAPIIKADGDPTDPAVKEKFVKAKLSYSLIEGETEYEVIENGDLSTQHITLLTEGSASLRRGYAVKVDTTDFPRYRVLETVKVSAEKMDFAAEEGIGWMLCSSSTSACGTYLGKLQKDDTVTFSVASPDGTWNGYETILGCRQALVIDDRIASTVTKENTNGAQSPDVPRSAVGIKDDHTVVIFAVESMYYGKKAGEGDPHGMNLPELAEFAYFYGCNQAANFDGGGSTQLVVRGEEEESGRVVIRSSDTASTSLTNTRPVMNAILVTSRKEA